MDYSEHTYYGYSGYSGYSGDNDHDDFAINHKSGGGKGKDKKKTNGGSCYNSKHIRIQEEKKTNSSKKK